MEGGLLGIGLGYSMLRVLPAAMPRFTLPWATDIRLSLPVPLFTLSATTLAGLLFGCVPAWFASRSNPGEAIKSGAHVGLGVGRHRPQQILVTGEVPGQCQSSHRSGIVLRLSRYAQAAASLEAELLTGRAWWEHSSGPRRKKPRSHAQKKSGLQDKISRKEEYGRNCSSDSMQCVGMKKDAPWQTREHPDGSFRQSIQPGLEVELAAELNLARIMHTIDLSNIGGVDAG